MKDFRDLLHHEISVNLALLDMLRPGDCAFDVGANVGTQAAIMSRLVGPRGAVVAVEANPKTAETARDALLRLGCANTLMVNRAVAERTGEVVQLFLGNGPNDSLIPHPWISSESVDVETATIDELSEWLEMDPVLVKMDVEGAELRGLQGAERLIARRRPTFILEQNAQDVNCVAFLRERGYSCLDLNSYLPITQAADYPHHEQNPVRNIVCYPSEVFGAARRSPYEGVRREAAASFATEDFHLVEGGWTSRPVKLAGGRYSATFDYACPDDLQVRVAVLDSASSAFIEFYEAPAGWLRYACFDLPFHLDADAQVQIVIRPKDGIGEVEPLGGALDRAVGLPARRPARSLLF